MKQFIFKDYSFDQTQKTAVFNYGFDDGQDFSETYKFDFDFADFDPNALDRTLQMLFFMAGISYYKAYLPPEIIIQKGQITAEIGGFLRTTYQKGLGELFYINELDPSYQINFPINCAELPPIKLDNKGILVSIGGGKDSLVSYELLKSADNTATWSLGHQKQLQPLVDKIGARHFWVERRIDKKIIQLNAQPDVYNGHVPISAIFACVGSVVAILSGYQDNVMSNEQSANESTLRYQGTLINHQYSKSSAFERNFQAILTSHFGDSLRYYSLLRPLREIAIVRQFASQYLDKYTGVFSSCNRAFTQNNQQIFWCGQCPKCAGIYLLMSPFARQAKLKTIYGANLLLNSDLEPIYRQLLGIRGDKPLECVGEIAENRWAMSEMKSKYPELEKFHFQEANPDDVWSLSPHDIPEDIIQQFNLDRQFENFSVLEKI